MSQSPLARALASVQPDDVFRLFEEEFVATDTLEDVAERVAERLDREIRFKSPLLEAFDGVVFRAAILLVLRTLRRRAVVAQAPTL